MSFHLWLVCLDRGEVTSFPRAMVEDACAPFIESRGENSWKLSDCLADLWINSAAEIGGFSVTRPPGDKKHPFWQALLSIMHQTQTVLHWPTGGPLPHAVVADESVIAHMPADMLRIVGRPNIVRKPEEFWQRIGESGA
jgi:hypothetical protein